MMKDVMASEINKTAALSFVNMRIPAYYRRNPQFGTPNIRAGTYCLFRFYTVHRIGVGCFPVLESYGNQRNCGDYE